MSRKHKQIEFTPIQCSKPVTGTVLWVHPRGRYALVGYRLPTPMGMSPLLYECLQIVQGQIVKG